MDRNGRRTGDAGLHLASLTVTTIGGGYRGERWKKNETEGAV